jgi:DNA-binding transcriptional LysR family regulator
MFNIADLYLFELVNDSGSFTKAAQRNYMTPPAVMHRINELEKAIGVSLFKRTSTGVTLTVPGQVLHKHAQALIDESEQLMNQVRESEHGNQFTIRIGSSLLNPTSPKMELWNRVIRENPQYHLQFVPLETVKYSFPEMYQHLGEEVDILFGPYGFEGIEKATNFLKLGDYHYTITMHANDPLAKKSKITINDLSGERLAMIPKGRTPIIDSLYQLIAETGNNIQTVDTDEHYTINTFNRFITTEQYLLTLECWKDVLPGLVSRPLNVPITTPYGIIAPHKPSQGLATFLQILKNTINDVKE